MAGYHSLDRKAHLLNYYRVLDDNPYRYNVFLYLEKLIL